MLWICGQIKKTTGITIRVNTNGHASLIAGYDTTPLFKGLVDKMNISLNAPSAEEYNRICNPEFGIKAYGAMLDFIKKVRNYVPDIVLSVVRGTTNVKACQKIADELGLPMRIR